MKIYHYEKLNKEQIENLCQRDFFISKEIQTIVENIGKKVQKFGDVALKEITKEIDGVTIEKFKVENKKVEQISINSHLKSAINTAKKNIWKFHSLQKKELKQKLKLLKEFIVGRNFVLYPK